MATIMVAEDDVAIQRLIAEILSDHDVRVTSSGLEALAAIQTHPPDVLILDLMLPELSGAELLAAVRSNPVTALLPVVVVSAVLGKGANGALPVAAVLPKPFRIADLIDAIERIITP